MCWKLCEEGEETVTRGPGVSQDVLVRPAFGESYIMFLLLHNILVRSNFGKEQATSFGESCLWFLTLSTLLLLRTISWMIQLRESPLLRWWTSNGRIIPFLLRLWSRSSHWIVFSPPPLKSSSQSVKERDWREKPQMRGSGGIAAYVEMFVRVGKY